MISACQFGITLASLGLGALAEPVVASLLTGPWPRFMSRMN
jgi:CBS domain containing-hemolysin-like protein